MIKNMGNSDRVLRAIAAPALFTCCVMAPLPLVVRATAFGGMGTYMAITALVGTCLGYRMIGKSTCPGSASS
jgi:Protein of unknown function (DUF2892)